MASFAAARSIFRSNSARNAAARLASQAKTKAAPSPFGVSAKKPLSLAALRSAPLLVHLLFKKNRGIFFFTFSNKICFLI